jgi:hypothetical protein
MLSFSSLKEAEYVLESLIATYTTVQDLEDAVAVLGASTFPIEQISVIARALDSHTQVHGFATSGFLNRKPLGAETWFEGVFSMLIGAAFIWLPRFGQIVVAGPLSDSLQKEFSKKSADSIEHPLGSLMQRGIPLKNILFYEASIQKGDFLLLIQGNHEQVKEVADLLFTTNKGTLNLYGLLNA